MATELPPEQRASYSAIIDKILASSDLTTISSKAIRKGLQEKVEYDLTPQKDAIKSLIMERFDKVQREQEESGTLASSAVPEPAPTVNGTTHHANGAAAASRAVADSPRTPSSASPYKRKAGYGEDEEDEELSDVIDTPLPKKVKKSSVQVEETDEQIAKRMQAELNAAGARSTRGGGAKRRSTVKKQVKKKSKTKVGSDEDSDLESGEKPEREKKGGFHKLMTLSPPLSAMLGETALSRPQTVKRIWNYIKANDLQNPSDKREIRCDDTMRAVFKQDKVHMFTMNKLLAQHLYNVDE